MASMVALRDGLKVRLQTISGLRVFDWHTGEVSTPAAVILPGNPNQSGTNAITFDATMGRGSDDYVFTVVLLVSNAHDRTAADNLDAYLAGSGSSSVKAAIEGDGTLGGAAHFARVQSVREYGVITYGNVPYLGAQFVVEVTA